MENEIELNKIKENLYSRQIGTYGEDAMKKIIQLNILILGLKGVGVEVAKNIILTGPERVVIYDPDIVKLKDLGSNYYLSENDINKNRIDNSCLNSLSELNLYTNVEVLKLSYNDFYKELEINKFNVIVQTEIKSNNEIILLDEYCRKNKIKFIYGAALGLSGFIFSDFGKNHTIYDQNGIESKKYLCKNITNSEKALITVVDEFDNPFNLDDNDYIIFKNVKGMFELNDNKPRKIKIIDDNLFSIEENTIKYHKFEGNGDVIEYKNPVKMEYTSFNESINLPFKKTLLDKNFTDQQETKLHQNLFYLSIILSISDFLEKYNNDIFLLKDEELIQKILNNSEKKFNDMIKHELDLGFDYDGYEDNEIQNYDKKIAYNIVKFSQYNIVSICSIIGGYISQEIIKATGKYIPINQWIFFNLYDYNNKYGMIENFQKVNNRYHDQICIFGEKVQEKLENLKIFVSGAGAVGCELLKNIALMGASTGKDGLLTITDYDNIENSNLNRQFLFNHKNINQSKSTIACKEIKKMNKNFNCKDLHKKVCKETENYFNKNFWENQDIIFSAVDNDDARTYLNDICFKYNKILMNAGTSGVRAKADIIIPKITYPLKIDLNNTTKEYNMCTIKKFPTRIEHCIKWSKDLFSFLFNDNMEIFNKFLKKKKEYIKQISKEPDDVFLDLYKIIKNVIDILKIENEEKRNYKIVEIGINYFYNFFIKSIENLLLIYPQNKIDDGILFWSGSRKKPIPLTMNINDEMTKQFLYTFCFIFSHCLKIKFDKNQFDKILNEISQNIYKNFINKKKDIPLTDEIKKEKINELNEIIMKLEQNKNIYWEVNQEIFEKDGLNNYHIEFIQACANLRARNYSIVEESKNKILMISGQIIASVPTSTSAIVGYLTLQMINLMYTNDTFNVIKNAYLHLGLNIFDLIPQEKLDEDKGEEKSVNEQITKSYPEIEIKESKTLKEFLDFMLNNYGIEVFHFEIKDKILYDKRVTKNPSKIQKQMEKNQKKIEDLYYEQIGKANEIVEDISNKILMIKINCRIKNEENKQMENIYNFPLIKYLIN